MPQPQVGQSISEEEFNNLLLELEREKQKATSFGTRLRASFGSPEEREASRQAEREAGLRGKFDIGDIADIAGGVPGFLGFAFGTTAGAAAGGPAGGVLGGGAGAAAGEAIRQGIGRLLDVQRDVTIDEAVKEVATEGVLGTIAGGLGLAISKGAKILTKSLPFRVTNQILKDERATRTFLEAGRLNLRGVDRQFEISKNAVKSLSSQIDDALIKSPRANTISGKEIGKLVKEALPEANLTNQQVRNILSRAIPTKQKTINKLFDESITPKELWSLLKPLNSELQTAFKALEKGKLNFALSKSALLQARQIMSELVKERSGSPIVRNLFSQLSKEITLRNVLEGAATRASKHLIIGPRDLIGAGIGGLAGGPIGTVAGIAIERGLTSPDLALPLSQLLSEAGRRASRLITPAVGTAGRSLLREGLREFRR